MCEKAESDSLYVFGSSGSLDCLINVTAKFKHCHCLISLLKFKHYVQGTKINRNFIFLNFICLPQTYSPVYRRLFTRHFIT